MSSYANPPTNLEALLRNTCRRALALGLSFTNQIRVYRSVIALAREVRLRYAGAMQGASAQSLAALLAAVCEHASETGLDPELPLPDAIMIQRLALQLSRAARRAGAIEPIERAFREQHAMHRDKPAQPAFSAQDPIHREEPAQPDAAEPAGEAMSPQHPLHRETEAPDDRLSAWRNDHKTDRDQRAHEKLRTVIDARLISKVKAMNKRDREARAVA